MELIKKNIHMEHRINWASTQISLEEDQNISDQKPDAFKIICKKAGVKVEEAKPVEEAVWVKGVLDYTVLYLTDEKEKRLCSMEGQIPFEEKVYTEKNVSGDSMRIQTKAEDLSILVINSRKINIRSVIGLEITQDELYDEEVAVDVNHQEHCEILKKPMDITTILLDTRDIYRIREEIQVPDGLPNIYSLIWKNVRIDGLSFTPMEGRIGIAGEVNAFFLYEGEEEETMPRYFEVNRPFSGVLEVPECKENMQIRMDYEVEPVYIETKPDYDGEERQIELDAEIRLYIKIYQNMTLSLVADAYSISENIVPVMKDSTAERILKKESGKIKVSDMWENTENPGEELQILHIDGNLSEEEVQIGEEEAGLDGVVHVEILCSVNDEMNPYRCIGMDIPYHHSLTVNGAMPQSPYYGKVCIEQINAVMQGERIEARVILMYQLLVYQIVSEPLLTEIKREESNPEKTLPGMAVYFAKDNENIWEIGKKYQVPLCGIRDINQLNTDVLQEGQKILIVKEMV